MWLNVRSLVCASETLQTLSLCVVFRRGERVMWKVSWFVHNPD